MIDLPTRGGFLEVVASGSIQLNGWAFVDVGLPVPPEVFLELFSRRTRTVRRVKAQRCERPDVAAHFRDQGLTYCGFTVWIDLNQQMYGEYSARVYQVDHEQTYRSDELIELRVALQEYEKTVREGLARKFLHGRGLEIGALQRKLQVPTECHVTYVDRMPLEELVEHYPEMAHFNLQRPDIIDDGETLSSIPPGSQDFVIANHFLEHSKNPIQTIENFFRVLKDGGVLYMAVPDKRYTFDCSRRLTAYAELSDARQCDRRAGLADLYVEWAREVQHTPEHNVIAVAKQLASEKYSIHFNVWTLDSLMDFLLRSREDFALQFDITAVVSADNEAVFVLTKKSRYASEMCYSRPIT